MMSLALSAIFFFFMSEEPRCSCNITCSSEGAKAASDCQPSSCFCTKRLHLINEMRVKRGDCSFHSWQRVVCWVFCFVFLQLLLT